MPLSAAATAPRRRPLTRSRKAVGEKKAEVLGYEFRSSMLTRMRCEASMDFQNRGRQDNIVTSKDGVHCAAN